MASVIPCGGSWGKSISIIVEGSSEFSDDPQAWARNEAFGQYFKARAELQAWVAMTDCKPGCEKIVVWDDLLSVKFERTEVNGKLKVSPR